MGGFAMAFAGGLSGLGKGLATKGTIDLEQRYREAMENLRSSNNMAETKNQYDYADRNSARDDARNFNNRMAEKRVDQAFTLQTGKAASEAKAAEKQSEREFELQKMRLEAQLDMLKTSETEKLKSQIESGKLKEFKSDPSTGTVYAMYNDGTSKVVQGANIKPLPNASSGGSLLLDQNRQGSGPVANRPPLSSFQN